LCPDEPSPDEAAEQVILALSAFKKRVFVEPVDQDAPCGFKLRVEIRKTGSSAGKKDFYVYTPAPKRIKLRSVLETRRFFQSAAYNAGPHASHGMTVATIPTTKR
tara:strand:- start:6982 stop:7296 length:315 start_codon:yes stop_codon:yes gene_type:complete